MGWWWHGAVSDIFCRPPGLAWHGQDPRGGIPFRGGTDRGDLVARLLPDRRGLAFGRFVYGVDSRPGPLRYAGRLAVSQIKDSPRLPERIRVPESPGLSWVSGLMWITLIVRRVTALRVAAHRIPVFGIAIRWVAVRGTSPLARVGTVTVQGLAAQKCAVPGLAGVGGVYELGRPSGPGRGDQCLTGHDFPPQVPLRCRCGRAKNLITALVPS